MIFFFSFLECQGKQQKESSANNAVATINSENRADELLDGHVREVTAQKGGTAVLPCKVVDAGGGIVSEKIFYFKI